MNILIRIAVLFVIPIMFIKCSNAQSIPKTMPMSFTIEYSYYGGMRGGSERYFISKDTCYYEKIGEHRGDGKIKKINKNFKVTLEELNQLYKLTVQYHFYDMKTEKIPMINDYPSTSLVVNIVSKYYSVNINPTNALMQKWKGEFENLRGKLFEFVYKKN